MSSGERLFIFPDRSSKSTLWATLAGLLFAGSLNLAWWQKSSCDSLDKRNWSLSFPLLRHFSLLWLNFSFAFSYIQLYLYLQMYICVFPLNFYFPIGYSQKLQLFSLHLQNYIRTSFSISFCSWITKSNYQKYLRMLFCLQFLPDTLLVSGT